MTMHKDLHPKDNIGRLSMSTKEERRWYASIEYYVDASNSKNKEMH